MTPLTTLANDDPARDPAQEIRQGALSAAEGDTTQAFILLSEKTADLLDGTNRLQAEMELCRRANERYKKYYGYDDESWLEKAWDSDVVKVGIFIGGMWLGARVASSVN